MSYQLSIPTFPVPIHKPSIPASFKAPGVIQQPIANPKPIQKISITATCCTLYNDFSEFSKKRRHELLLINKQPKQDFTTGRLGKSAKTGMRRALNWLFLISKVKWCRNEITGSMYPMKNNFITLTLSDKQRHSDHEIKQVLLKNFIDGLRRRYPSISYVWKAEPQKNGNIHFHIITDHFIPMSYVNRLWNGIQRRHGYIDKYFSKYGTWEPPSTETRKVKGRERSANYMCKYFLKEHSDLTIDELKAKIKELKELSITTKSKRKLLRIALDIESYNTVLDHLTRRKIQGKLWGCSDNLLLKPFTTIFEDQHPDNIENVYSQKNVADTEYYSTFVYNSLGNFLNGFTRELRKEVRFYLRLLIPPKKIPDIIYSPSLNYRY